MKQQPIPLKKAEPIEVADLIERKAALEAEFRKGQAVLQQQQAAVEVTRVTMMHIQGAVSLLNDLLAEASPEPKVVKVERMSPNGAGQDAEVPDPIP